MQQRTQRQAKAELLLLLLQIHLKVCRNFIRVLELNADQTIMCSSTYQRQREDRILFGDNLLLINALNLFAALSADAGVWKPEGRNITNYSARHYYATQAIMRRLDIYDIALNMGTSIQYLQSTYIHATTLDEGRRHYEGSGHIQSAMDEREEKREMQQLMQ